MHRARFWLQSELRHPSQLSSSRPTALHPSKGANWDSCGDSEFGKSGSRETFHFAKLLFSRLSPPPREASVAPESVAVLFAVLTPLAWPETETTCRSHWSGFMARPAPEWSLPGRFPGACLSAHCVPLFGLDSIPRVGPQSYTVSFNPVASRCWDQFPQYLPNVSNWASKVKDNQPAVGQGYFYLPGWNEGCLKSNRMRKIQFRFLQDIKLELELLTIILLFLKKAI